MRISASDPGTQFPVGVASNAFDLEQSRQFRQLVAEQRSNGTNDAVPHSEVDDFPGAHGHSPAKIEHTTFEGMLVLLGAVGRLDASVVKGGEVIGVSGSAVEEAEEVDALKLNANPETLAKAQKLVDHYTEFPLSWEGVQSYAYGPMLYPSGSRSRDLVNADSVYGRNLPTPVGPYLIEGEGDGASRMGSIAAGEGWVPSLQEALQIIEAFEAAPRGQQVAAGHLSAQEVIRSMYGDLPAPFVEFLASKTNLSDPVDGAPNWRPSSRYHNELGIITPLSSPDSYNPRKEIQKTWDFPVLQAVKVPYMDGNASTKNESRTAFADFISQAKL